MKKVNSRQGFDLYRGEDEKVNGKPWYNIVPKDSPIPTSGYYSAEYIAKIKKVPVRYFF